MNDATLMFSPGLFQWLFLALIVVVVVIHVIDWAWKQKVEKWAKAQDEWAEEVSEYLDTYAECLKKVCGGIAGEDPPGPPCKFGHC